MKIKSAKHYRAGSFVYIQDVSILKKSFHSWIPCQVFKVSDCNLVTTFESRKLGSEWIVWLESYSTGIGPKHCIPATKEQIARYKLEHKKGTLILGHGLSLPLNDKDKEKANNNPEILPIYSYESIEDFKKKYTIVKTNDGFLFISKAKAGEVTSHVYFQYRRWNTQNTIIVSESFNLSKESAKELISSLINHL